VIRVGPFTPSPNQGTNDALQAVSCWGEADWWRSLRHRFVQSNACRVSSSSSAPAHLVAAAQCPGTPSVSVEFAPSWDGGSPVFTFTASWCSSDGRRTRSASGMSTPIVVTALTNGAHYTCTVTATNALGTSPPSATSNDVLAGAPGAPGGLSPIPTSSSVSISWTAPPPNASP